MRQAEVNSTTVASNLLSNISLFIMFTHIEQHYPEEKSEKVKGFKDHDRYHMVKWKLDTLLTFYGKNRVFIQTKVAWTTICRRNENITRNKHVVCKLGISKYWDECETELFTIINLNKF